MNDKSIRTKYGTARIQEGYYRISSRNEGNHSKYLHRLVWEENFGEIPPNFHIHHKDGNKLNCDISNLELISKSEHHRMHRKGVSVNDDVKRNISLKVSQNQQNGLPYRVSIQKSKTYEQGFCYRYVYPLNGIRKAISSKNLNELKEKVLNKNLEWIEADELDDMKL